MHIATFGEIMLRLSTPNFQKLIQSIPGNLVAEFGGGEANVAISLVQLGCDTTFITALPDSPIGKGVEAELKKYGVHTDALIFLSDSRLGIYFVESGAGARGSSVVYDRNDSAIAQVSADQFDWDQLLSGKQWFHTTGITPALSESAYNNALQAVISAHSQQIPVSIDLNYRKKLWKWKPDISQQELAGSCLRAMLPHASLVIGNEEDFAKVLGLEVEGQAIDQGQLNIQGYPQVARQVINQFPNVCWVGITLRESVSASHNYWGGMLYDRESDKPYFAPVNDKGEYTPYSLLPIVDRIGGGDSFAAGLIYALGVTKKPAPNAIAFAVAASALKHTIPGDFNLSSIDEIEALASGKSGGRISR